MLVAVLCAVVLMVTVASPASAAGARSSERAARAAVGAVVSGAFVDVVPGAAFYDDITWLAAQGIATGTALGDGTFQFRPAEAVTREAMAAFLYRFAGSPGFTAPLASPFVDVAPTGAFYKEIAWLAVKGISTGTAVGGGTFAFQPSQAVSREAMAAFLYRAEGRRAVTSPVASVFTDVGSSAPFYAEISWLAANGVSTGTSIGGGQFEFRPTEAVSREAMAAFLHRTATNVPADVASVTAEPAPATTVVDPGSVSAVTTPDAASSTLATLTLVPGAVVPPVGATVESPSGATAPGGAAGTVTAATTNPDGSTTLTVSLCLTELTGRPPSGAGP